MIVLSNTTEQTVAPGQSITFNTLKHKSGCAECWRQGTSSVKMKNSGVYQVSFSANIGGETAATPVQIALAIGGDVLPATTMISVPAAVADRNNVSVTTGIRNCCCDYDRITVTNNGTVPVIIGANPLLFVKREG